MGLLSTIARALGLTRPPAVADRGPLRLSERGAAALASLPEGHALHVDTVAATPGRLVRAVVAVRAGPLRPELEGPVVISDDDWQRLDGLQLDVDGDRWLVRTEVRLTARETPNPDGRMYLADRLLAAGRVSFRRAGPDLPPLIHDLLHRDDVQGVLLREHTLTVERTPGAPWDQLDAAVAVAVREHFLRCGGVVTPAQLPPRTDPLEAAVYALLEREVLPALHRDGGDMELIAIEDGIAKVHMVGACSTCPASELTLHHGVQRTLVEAFPGEIVGVEAV